MRDLKAELELMNEKNPPMRTNFDYRDMVIRAQMAEAEVERLRGQVEKHRQALNRVLAFTNDCPRYHGLEDGVKECAIENIITKCNECWKIALGVEKDD